MDRRKGEPLDVIDRDWRINEEAEKTCSHQIPERDCHEEVDGPFVVGDPLRLLCRLREANILPGFVTDQSEWHNLECTENRTEANHGGSCTGKVEVVKRADDSAGEKDGG